jgi:hypothetical protein
MILMAIEKYIGKPRGFTRPNYRDLHTGKVTVDDEGRVFLFGTEEVGPVAFAEHFHFYQAETGEDWPKVRAYYKLPKTMRWSCRSHGARQGEGHKVGLYPKKPIQDIQEERGKEAGETTWRMPSYGKQFERDIRKSMSEAAAVETLKPKSTTESVVDAASLVLSRNCAAPSARLGHLALEGQGAFASQC